MSLEKMFEYAYYFKHEINIPLVALPRVWLAACTVELVGGSPAQLGFGNLVTSPPHITGCPGFLLLDSLFYLFATWNSQENSPFEWMI